MNGMKRTVFAALTLLIAASITACGGGGGGIGGSGGGGGGGLILAGAVSQGVLTAKGSVFVNGIEFSTAGATVKVNGVTATEADLKVGMVVTVHGTSDDVTRKGTATQVEARDALEGTIQSLDAANKTITVMGQTVRIEDNVTRLNDDDAVKVFTAANFQVGNFVNVNAFPDDQGGLRATRVAKTAPGEFSAKGFVVSIGTGSFGLGLTPGGTATATVTGTLPTGAVVGSFVEVKAAAAPAGSTITATSVTLEDKLGAAGEKAEVEGIATSGDVNSFVLNGKQVVTSTTTIFEAGLRSDFAVGSRVAAEGPLDANGTIAATKVTFRSNIKIEADLTAFTAGSSLTLLGGKTVTINQFTRTDGTPAVGSHVEVRAMPDRDGNLIATRIVVKNADTRAFLQGPVTAVNATAGTMTILGVSITTTGAGFRISTDQPTTQVTAAATFFAQVSPNVTVVKVRWRPFTSPTLPVDEAEIEQGTL
jgi:hypothetical protein